MTEKDRLAAAYSLKTPDDSRKLYADWADTYDFDFVAASGYQLHAQVARAFVEAGGQAPILDMGAGTGLCGVSLNEFGLGEVDATDISPEMLEKAAEKSVYRALFPGDILAGLDLPDGVYSGIVSAGTFTLGHVGPDGLDEVVRLLEPGGLAVIAVRDAHFEEAGFTAKLAELGRRRCRSSARPARICPSRGWRAATSGWCASTTTAPKDRMPATRRSCCTYGWRRSVRIGADRAFRSVVERVEDLTEDRRCILYPRKERGHAADLQRIDGAEDLLRRPVVVAQHRRAKLRQPRPQRGMREIGACFVQPGQAILPRPWRPAKLRELRHLPPDPVRDLPPLPKLGEGLRVRTFLRSEEAREIGHLPFQTGSRFSAKARAPSF